MANDTDFLSLYHELGVRPDCGLSTFRQAYRRRVSQLHPDRRAGAAGAMRELQRLNALYSAAIDFEHRHGRLPGSVQAPPRPSLQAQRAPSPHHARRPRSGRRWHMHIFLIGIAGLITFLYLYFDETTVLDDPAPAIDLGETLPEAPPNRSGPLDLGMEASEVLEIEGEPISRSASLWEYGPSWISFECRTVTDWYSSPMRPLKVATQRPKPHEAEPVPHARCVREEMESAAQSGS